MNSTEKITDVITSLRELCGVGICYYDLKNFFNYNSQGVRGNRGHYCRLCEETRSLPGGKSACEKSDRSEAVMLAEQYKSPFFFECHMGMRELVLPLMRNGTLIGVIFIGQCRMEGEDMRRTVMQNARRLGGDPDRFAALYDSLPLFTRSALMHVGNILQHFFDAQILSSNLLIPVEDVEGQPLAQRIRKYIDCCYTQNVTPGKLAEKFFVNAAYASRVFSREYGITITDYMNCMRVERAKTLLDATSAPIGSIAINVGFSDANYFSRVFRRITGLSPGEYRKHSGG